MILSALLLAATLDLAGYRARLEHIDAALAAGDRAAAAAQAKDLLDSEIEQGDETLAPDAWVLRPIADGAPHRGRLRGLLDRLAAPAGAPVSVDRALLDRARAEQRIEAPDERGDLGPLPIEEPSFVRRMLTLIREAAEWTGDLFGKLWDWFTGLWPSMKSARGGGTTSRILGAVFFMVGLIVVVVAALGLRVLLRKTPPQVAVSTARPAREDEDPLARTASGWEERARTLASEGRFREAIRAWYHAALVQLYGAGALQYRRGRTNWEYVHAVSPSHAWRGAFEDLTRQFDVEWYGHARSTEEAFQRFSSDTARLIGAVRGRA